MVVKVFFSVMNSGVLRPELNFLPEQKLLVLMVLLEWSELMSHSFPSSSEKGESDKGEPLSFGRKGWRTRRGMRLRGLPFSGDFFSCSKQHLSGLQTPTLTQRTFFFRMIFKSMRDWSLPCDNCKVTVFFFTTLLQRKSLLFGNGQNRRTRHAEIYH